MTCYGYRRKAQRSAGYSLVEVAIVLAVISVILGALWVAASQAWEYSKREQAKEAISTTVANMRSTFAGQAGVTNTDYATLTSAMLLANNVPISLMRVSNCAANCVADNPWNGGSSAAGGTFRVCNWPFGPNTTACPSSAPGAISPFFGVALTNLTQKGCIALAEYMSGSMGPTGLVDVNINGKNLAASASPVPVQPVSSSDATNNCTAQPDGGDSIIFIYRIDAPTL